LQVGIAIRPALWGEALHLLLAQQPDLRPAGTAQTEDELAHLMSTRAPDLVLFDYEALGPGAEAVIGRLRRSFPLVRVLVLASRSSDDTVVAVLRAGAAGLVSKNAEYATLLAAIRAVGAGETWANRRVTARALDELVAPLHPALSGATQLTQRETEVVDGVGRGLRNREIALALGVSEKTVKTHLNNVFAKLGVRSRTALALWAMDQAGQKT
jgi:DNA-binding NarL/FixJ family response regulator